MPVLQLDGLQVEFTSGGRSDQPAVLLIHSSVSGRRQWRRLVAELADDFFVVAPDLFGYGATSPWLPEKTLAAVADMALQTANAAGAIGPIAIVGHSYGGAVALKAAERLGSGLAALAVFEPIPFHLLREIGDPVWTDVAALVERFNIAATAGKWEEVAVAFTDYWLGPGHWTTMPAGQRIAFLRALPPLIHELEAVFAETTPLATWASAWAAPSLIVGAAHAQQSVQSIVALLRSARPDWPLVTAPTGGHMAPLSRPDLVNPILINFLREHHQ